MAILPVVGFHAFPGWFPGGFIGVDVFFVISGFLISTIIFKSLDRSDFSFIDFYVRRIRRIFPALLVVLAVSLVLGRHVLLGSEFEMLGRHIAAGAGFVQNFVLWQEAGYFDLVSEMKPMLHLWSLAIEEQFYLLFPLLMWAAWRLRINLLIPVGVILVASFAANLYGIRHDAVATFFAPQTRFWELMAGAVLAWFIRGTVAGGGGRRHQAGTPNAAVSSIASIVGLSLVLLAIFGLDRSMPYPGEWAVLPVLGAVLLIFSGPAALANRFMLSNRFAVSVGRISYPLYLWHWPLLSFLAIINGGLADGTQRFAVVLLSFLLAWLTFRFVERPVRTGNRDRKLVTSGLMAGIAAMAVLGLNVGSFARIYDEPIARIVAVWEFSNYPRPTGHFDARYNLLTYGHNEEDKVLIIGESHADQYVNTIAAALQRQAARNESSVPEVMFSMSLVFPPVITDQVLEDKSIKTVVFSYFWALQYRSEKVNTPIRCCGSGLMGVIGIRTPPATAEQMNEFDASLEGTVRALGKAGKRVYFILDNPFGEEIAPRSLVKRSLLRGIEVVTPPPLSRILAIQRDEPIRSRVLKIAQATGADVIDPMEWLCDETCPALSANGSPAYKDYDHLSLDALMRAPYLDMLVMPAEADGAARR